MTAAKSRGPFIAGARGAAAKRLVPLVGAEGDEIVETAAAPGADGRPRAQSPARHRPPVRIARGARHHAGLQLRPNGSLLPDATVAISLVVVGAAVSLTLTASLVSACIAPCATALEPVAA
jgi:hypothetical protein